MRRLRQKVRAVASLAALASALSGCASGSHKSADKAEAALRHVSAAHPATVEYAVASQTSGPCQPQPAAGVVCTGGNGYRFDPRRIGTLHVTKVDYGIQQANVGWALMLSLDPASTKTFATLSRQLQTTRQMFVWMIPKTHEVITAAGVEEPILDGKVQLTGGSLKESTVRRMAEKVASTRQR